MRVGEALEGQKQEAAKGFKVIYIAAGIRYFFLRVPSPRPQLAQPQTARDRIGFKCEYVTRGEISWWLIGRGVSEIKDNWRLCWHAVAKLRGDGLEFLERGCAGHLDVVSQL